MKKLLNKAVVINFPVDMIAHTDRVAAKEHRTRSDLIREALRRYLMEADRIHGQEEQGGQNDY